MQPVLATHLFLYYNLTDGAALETIKRFGFDAVELWAMRPHFPYDDPAGVDKIRELGDKIGVAFRTAHLPMYERIFMPGEVKTLFSPSHESAERRDAWRKHTAASMQAAFKIGARNFTLHTDLKFPGPDPRIENCRKSLEALLANDLPDGAVVSVENDVGGVEQVTGLLDIIDGMDPAKIGITVDLGHTLVAKKAPECVRAAGSRLKVVHAHDNGGAGDEHLAPGAGVMPWREVFDALRDVRFDGPLVYEIRDPGKGSPGFDKIIPLLKETQTFERARQKP